jgi:hypothetical protein
MAPDTAASGIPYEGTDCTPEEAVEAVQAVRASAACRDYFALPNLTCGLIAGHAGPHVAARPARRIFRWLTTDRGRRFATR